jgi:transposase
MAPPPSHSQSVLPDPKTLILDGIEQQEAQFILSVHARQVPCCPRCGRSSGSKHSHYARTIQDLPWQGLSVRIRLKVRRFRCRNAACDQKIFSERLPGTLQPYARRSDRLGTVIRLVGYNLGGLPGSRILDRLAVQVSDDTVLRTVKRPNPACGEAEPLRHLGVDDWAWKKGQNYGTILVDLERHKVADLLPERSAESFEQWLHRHPNVETVNRDRCGLYAEGASRGAPDAVQIADRFHLVLNLSAAIERALEEHRDQLQLPVPQEPETAEQVTSRQKTETLHERGKQQRRKHRVDRYQKVTDLHSRGFTQKQISEAVGLSQKTVRRWLRSSLFPERKPAAGRRSHVREFHGYLRQRWEQGCHNSAQLFREIRTRGYRGSRQMVSYHVSAWRGSPRVSRGRPFHQISPKEAAILICKRPEDRSASQQELFDRLRRAHPTFYWIHTLAIGFREALQSKNQGRMRDWICAATQSGVGPITRFAYGIRRDREAVIAAVESDWSSGQVEGQINRLKALKRQMYGRAGFTLLRARVLPYGAAPPP